MERGIEADFNTDHKRTSFLAGYRSAREGRVTCEMSDREIAVSFPSYDAAAFAQGLIDGLEGDTFRYRLIRQWRFKA